MEMICASCGAPLKDGEPHCHLCNSAMVCEGDTCACACGNTFAPSEAKCDICLEM